MTDRDETLIHLQYIRDKVDNINAHLDVLNGRVRTNETSIAVLRDRADSARDATRGTGAKWGAGAGAVISGAIAAGWRLLTGP